MKRGIGVLRAAEQEFDDAIAWYEAQREGLGKQFRAFIEGYFQRIAEHPERFPKIRGEVRRAVVQRFPFVIHFFVETSRVIILSVFHTSRNPDQLEGRR